MGKNYPNAYYLVCYVTIWCKMCTKINQVEWAMFAFVMLSTTQSEGIPDLTLISQKFKGNKYRMTCVINESSTDSAIAWNEPLPPKGDDVTTAVSEYIPSRSNQANCDIGFDDTACNRYWQTINGWTLQRSLDNALQPVTDRRWEELKILYTSGSYEFKHVVYLDKANFKVHISIRIKEEAHIYLCDYKYPPQARCYWILLGGWNGNKTAIRKCVDEKVPAGAYLYPKKECMFVKDRVEHTSTDRIVNEFEWRHFTVDKEANKILLWQTGKRDPILNYTDKDTTITTPYLSIRSNSPGFWKLHNYVYTFTRGETTTMLGPEIYINRNNFCMTMFVAMCSRCRLKLEVVNTNYEGIQTVLKTVTISPIKGMVWQQEKIVMTLQVTNIQLQVSSVCSENNCGNPFWAIDQFQICSEKEIRVLSIVQRRESATCQVIKYPYWHIIQTEVQRESKPETNCPVGTFGKSCTNCSLVVKDSQEGHSCVKSIICELKSNGKSNCGCAAGYTGTACETRCLKGWYGFDCKESCGRCAYIPCDYVTGECIPPGCVSNFTDPRCKTPPLPVLLNPPTIVEVGHTYFKVQIQNTTYGGSGAPSYYKLQYKDASQNATEWTHTEDYDYYNTKSITVQNLNILTSYVVRAILYTTNNEAYDKEYVPTTTVTTTCAIIEKKDIAIKTYNTSAVLKFKNNSESCKSEVYDVVIGDSKKVRSETFLFNVSGLQPDTTYQVYISNAMLNTPIEMHFTTTEGAPEKIQKLQVTRQDATSITISWKQPQVTNGNIKHYNIQYTHIKYTACGSGSDSTMRDSRKSIEEKSTSTIIKNLIPYSEYWIEITAVTIMAGEPFAIKANTLPTDTPEQAEIPTISAVKPDNTSVTITLEQPNCTLIKGPVMYCITADCSNSWCEQDIVTENITHTDHYNQIKVSKLRPYSNYTIQIKVARNHGNVFGGSVMTATFNTKSAKPNVITNLTAYSKNESLVSLRFVPPFPPNGKIDFYYLRYCYKRHRAWQEECKVQYEQPSECKLWANYHCVVLREVVEHQSYTITIFAKNVDTDYSNPVTVGVQTVQERPGVLENLTSTWDNYYNLTLIWGHPSITNGPLTKFIVRIVSEDIICYDKVFPITEDKYNRTYNYVISLEKCYSSKLKIYAAAFNIYEGPPATENVLSPPITPSFSTEPFVEPVTNTTLTVNLPVPKDLEPNSVVYVVVSHTNSHSNIINNMGSLSEIWDKLDLPKNAVSWVVAEFDFTEVKPTQKTFVIGNDTKSTSKRLNKELDNPILHSNTSYIITIVIINEFESFKRHKVYTIETSTSGMQSEEQKQSPNYGLFALLLLLLFPVMLWIIIRKKKESNAPWLTMLNMNTNLVRNSRSPDVIPLATSTENKPAKATTQIQLRPKRKVPVDDGAKLTEPSTSSANSELSKPVKIIEFENYVKESIENGELERQHQLFPRGQTKPWDYGLLPQNKSKNRYNNLIAYDHTRVKLAKINDDPYSDYINGNYIQGYNTKKAYIATQGPKAATVNDFWRMIWQENVNYIVMLANVVEGGKKKTEQYWPNVNEYLEFGNIKVEYVSSRVFADYEYRTFSVSSKNVERRLEQLHFTSWPDHGVPLYSQSLVPFLRKLLTIPQGTSPVVVHCSAGVGRTGTIILCDLCLRMAAREGIVDVLKHQHNLREQRANLVDNIEQYKLAHLVLLECLVAPQTSICCDEEMEVAVLRLLESERVAQQMQYLQETAWQDQAMRPPLEITPNPEWSAKNRFQDIIPNGYGRVYISRYPVTDEHSDYINAVEVDGFRSPQRFIVTQQPLRNTISDFWRMIDEKEVTTVVSLNKINLGDETSCVFWPTTKVNEIQPVPFLTLQFHNKSNTEHYSVITIHLRNNKDKKTTKHTVNLIILKGWPVNKLFPDEEESLLKLWEETERVSRGDNPIVITCYDGAKSCGLFIALSFVIEKMKLEQECDVCLAVRTVRHNRKQFVTEIDQFLFLYRAAISYLSCFDLYSNFTPVGKK